MHIVALIEYLTTGMQENRKDLSHPVHSDNCVLDEAMGECNKVPPAYTWRDYRYSYNIVIVLIL